MSACGAQPKNDQVLPFRAEPLPSRAADNLFWAGRYVERAEGTARLLRAIFLLRREQRDATAICRKHTCTACCAP